MGAQMALASCFSLCMFLFLTLILKVQTLTEAVQGSLTGQLARDFDFTPEMNIMLLMASTLGAVTVATFTIGVELTGAAIAQAKEHRKQEAMRQELAALRETVAARPSSDASRSSEATQESDAVEAAHLQQYTMDYR